MEQKAVFDLIADERDYQDATGRSIEEKPHAPHTWAAIAAEYCRGAYDKACLGSTEGAMESLRKAAAVCVAAMEQHGAPGRENVPNTIPAQE